MPGQCLLLLLGIEAWFSVYMAAAKSGTQVAVDLIQNYCNLFEGIESSDQTYLAAGLACRKTMQEALNLAEAKTDATANRTVYFPPPTPATAVTVAEDLAEQIRNNPLIDMSWLSTDEQTSINDSLEVLGACVPEIIPGSTL
ncbi:unnamed protein product [Calypogeia fissa]